MNFWAGNQNSNGYTVSAVMKWEGGYDLLNEDCRTPFLGSYSTSMPIDDPSDFSIGFEGQNTIYVNHAGQISYINLPLGITDEYRIYTITYSQSGTLEVYVNSGLIDTIQNVNPIERLQNGFLGLGRLGCSGILKVGEFLIYDRPLTNEERNAIEEELFIEYRL